MIKVPKRYFFLFALCITVLSSCEKDEDPYPQPAPANRVIIAYLGGDNNLSREVPRKLEALTAGFSTHGKDTDRLLVFYDTKEEEPAVTEVYRDAGTGSTQARLLETYDGCDSADGETLTRVIGGARARYPGASFGLIVFSHASGWLPEGMYLNPLLPRQPQETSAGSRSIVRDGIHEMEITELAAALPDNLLDYIVFETCFMAGIEVAYELRHKAPLILASCAEIVSPGFTPVYPDAFDYLLNGDMEGFARAAFRYANALSGWRRSATYSVIRTVGLQDLKDFINAHADFSTQTDVFNVQRFDRNAYRLFFDLEDYYSRLLATAQQRTELARLINECVVWKAATPTFMEGHGSFNITSHSGLTTYIRQPEFNDLNEAYEKLSWNK